MKYQTISIIVPIYNEKNTLLTILKRVQAADTKGLKKEIILVDDCSTDGSQELLKEITEPNCRIVLRSKNRGKGAALRAGFKRSTGDIILIQDADLEYHPEEYPLLLEPFFSQEADVVYGSRLMTNRSHRVLYYWHSVGNRLLTWLSNVFTNLNLTDMETCYKVFTRPILEKVLPRLTSNRFGFEPEFTARVAHLKPAPRIFEVGISYSGRTYEEGKKIGWKDGVATIFNIIRFNIFQ